MYKITLYKVASFDFIKKLMVALLLHRKNKKNGYVKNTTVLPFIINLKTIKLVKGLDQ